MNKDYIVYNVTVKVDVSIATEWLNWLKQEHIADVINTGCFSKAVIHRLLEVDNSEGPTFTIQYFAATKADYNRYIELHANNMRQKGFNKWGNKFIAFRSLMEIVN